MDTPVASEAPDAPLRLDETAEVASPSERPAPSWAGDNIAGTLRIDGPVRLSGLAADRRPDPTLLEGLDPLTCL
ncbi:MAG: hypothetical protein AAGI50_10685, partial [Pseudomonadota bacterium]